MAVRESMGNSEFSTKHEQGYDSLGKWIGKKFINIFLSAVIFFLAVLLAIMTFFPNLYESEAKVYVAAERGNTKVSAAAVGEALEDNGPNTILEGLEGFESVPSALRLRIDADLGEGTISIQSSSTDPYSAFDAVSRSIDAAYQYLEDNNAASAMRVVQYPEIAKEVSRRSLLLPSFCGAAAGFLLALILTLFSYGSYKRKYISEKRKEEQETASAYAAFAPGESRPSQSHVEFLSQDEFLKSLKENNDNVDAAKAGENIRKIMSAKDPNDESGKITIPAYAEDSDDSFDSDEEDEAVNFLSFLRNQTDDITVEDEFDDETEEEDLAKLFGDSESDLAEPDGAKGGA